MDFAAAAPIASVLARFLHQQDYFELLDVPLIAAFQATSKELQFMGTGKLPPDKTKTYLAELNKLKDAWIETRDRNQSNAAQFCELAARSPNVLWTKLVEMHTKYAKGIQKLIDLASTAEVRFF
jgi:hypothetical protein